MVIVLGKRRTTFGSIGHNLPWTVLRDGAQRDIEICTSVSWHWNVWRGKDEGCVTQLHVMGEMVFFSVGEILGWRTSMKIRRLKSQILRAGSNISKRDRRR